MLELVGIEIVKAGYTPELSRHSCKYARFDHPNLLNEEILAVRLSWFTRVISDSGDLTFVRS